MPKNKYLIVLALITVYLVMTSLAKLNRFSLWFFRLCSYLRLPRWPPVIGRPPITALDHQADITDDFRVCKLRQARPRCGHRWRPVGVRAESVSISEPESGDRGTSRQHSFNHDAR